MITELYAYVGSPGSRESIIGIVVEHTLVSAVFLSLEAARRKEIRGRIAKLAEQYATPIRLVKLTVSEQLDVIAPYVTH